MSVREEMVAPSSRCVDSMPFLGLICVAVLSLAPLILEPVPVAWIDSSATPLNPLAGKVLVVLGCCLVISLAGWLDASKKAPSRVQTTVMIGLAAAMTAWHAIVVDFAHVEWQRELYLGILNHDGEIPHRYRFLPYGFTRSIEWITGDWWFACLVYRWFFTYWFLDFSYRFARLFLTERDARWTLLPLVFLYPFSVHYYWGQLTDSMSHALFVLALIYVIEDRWLVLAVVLALGILAKETTVLIVLSYGVCYLNSRAFRRTRGVAGAEVLRSPGESSGASEYLSPGHANKSVRQYWKGFSRTVFLLLVCTIAYLAARLPLGWGLDFDKFNRTSGLMIGPNLFGSELYNPAAPLLMNYLSPLLFVGIFLPFIIARWTRIDWKLRVLFVTLVPLLLFTNLCFGWMYEARNYMPLVPLLATMAWQSRMGAPHLPGWSGHSKKMEQLHKKAT